MGGCPIHKSWDKAKWIFKICLVQFCCLTIGTMLEMTRPKQHSLTFPGRLLVPHLVESNLYDDGVRGSSVCYPEILIFGIFIWGSLFLRGWRHWRCSENPSRSYPFVRDVHIYLFQVYLSIQVSMPNVGLPTHNPKVKSCRLFPPSQQARDLHKYEGNLNL